MTFEIPVPPSYSLYCAVSFTRDRILISTFDSSGGRAVDCRWFKSDIHKSLVQIRLDGVFYPFLLSSKI